MRFAKGTVIGVIAIAIDRAGENNVGSVAATSLTVLANPCTGINPCELGES